MQNVLTQTYCAICDAVESFFKTLVTRKPKTFNRSTYNQLNALTDADLKDIGICRGDI